MRPRQALDTYLANYKDRQREEDNLLELFQQVRDRFGVTRALYPGSYVHITPALNQSQGGMCICRRLRIGPGGSQERLAP